MNILICSSAAHEYVGSPLEVEFAHLDIHVEWQRSVEGRLTGILPQIMGWGAMSEATTALLRPAEKGAAPEKPEEEAAPGAGEMTQGQMQASAGDSEDPEDGGGATDQAGGGALDCSTHEGLFQFCCCSLDYVSDVCWAHQEGGPREACCGHLIDHCGEVEEARPSLEDGSSPEDVEPW